MQAFGNGTALFYIAFQASSIKAPHMHPHHFEDFSWLSHESSDQNQTTAYGSLDTSAASAHYQHIWKVLLAFYDVTVITVFPLKVGIKLRTQRVECPSTN